MGAASSVRGRARSIFNREVRRLLTKFVVLARRHAPPVAWEAVVAARSFASRGPIVLTPTVARALVVAPHPDDETLGCGGTVALLNKRGCTVKVLVATSGEASVVAASRSATATAALRRDEEIAACGVLGAAHPEFLDLPDGQLSEHVGELTRLLARTIAAFDPEIVFVPWPGDGHPDHRAVPVALASVGLSAGVEIWAYEVWSPLPANRIVDVSPVWDAKTRALACHGSADESFDLTAHLALARWRSVFGLDGHGHAEAFLVLDPPALRALVERCRG